MPEAIVLDFNGTLAQDDHLVAPLYVEMFASVGVSLTTEQYHREFAAMPDEQVSAVALRRAGLPVEKGRQDQLVRARREGYLAAVAQEPPISPHALEFVHAAANHVLLGIVSGAFREEIELVLSAAGIRELFGAIVSIEAVHEGKPEPEGFTRAVHELGVEPHGAVAVEDATDGARAARAAGLRVAALRGPAYDEASGSADIVIARLDLQALERILAL